MREEEREEGGENRRGKSGEKGEEREGRGRRHAEGNGVGFSFGCEVKNINRAINKNKVMIAGLQK